MKKILFTALFGVLLIGQGIRAEAYGVLDETVVRLDESRTLYMMTYEFGFLNAETYMPMTAHRAGRGGNASTSAIYTLVREDGTVFEEGIARGVVVSTTETRKDEYYAPYGKKAFFTLLVLVDMPHPFGEKVQVRIDSIPLTIVKKSSARESLFLEGVELPGFTTSAFPL